MPQIKIITGPINSGKSTRLFEIANSLKARGEKIYGIIAEGIFENDKKIGFDIIDLDTGHRKKLARTNEKLVGFQLGKFHFSEKAFEFAKRAIEKGIDEKHLFIDEIGPMELDRKGYFDIFSKSLFSYTENIYVVVRENIMDEFLRLFEIDDFLILE
ncbi:MAG: nucleoside-triphosphatase [Candidatus Zixiibacteriota bacterium]